MNQDAARDVKIGDQCDEPAPVATVLASQDVDREHAPHELGPVEGSGQSCRNAVTAWAQVPPEASSWRALPCEAWPWARTLHDGAPDWCGAWG